MTAGPSVVVDIPVARVPRASAQPWLGLLEEAATRLRVVLVARDAGAARDLRRLTALPVVRARTTDELVAVYDGAEAAVVLHPLVDRRTFQALTYRRALHVYVGPPDAAGSTGTSHLLVAFDRVLLPDDEAAARVRTDLPQVDGSRVRALTSTTLAAELAETALAREMLVRTTPDLPPVVIPGAGAREHGARAAVVELALALAEGPGRRLRAWRGRRAAGRSGAAGASSDVGPADVVLYVADDPARLYQARQWLGVLEGWEGPAVAIVARHPGTAAAMRAVTTLPVHLVTEASELRDAYARLRARVVLYPSNSVRNVDSLVDRSVRHVHVGHGESDKASSVSRQSMAYDTVVVAGQVAVDRFRRGVLDGARLRLVACGRPQLDLAPAATIDSVPGRRTVLYAPTWGGESRDNNFTSLDVLGEAITRACLDDPTLRLVYRPHPRTVAAHDGADHAAHVRILASIEEASAQAPRAGHVCSTDGDVVGLFPATDLLVADVSSVLTDFLLLRPEAPVIVTDRRRDRSALVERSALAAVVPVLEPDGRDDVAAMLREQLDDDRACVARARLRDRYFARPVGAATRALRDLVVAEARLGDHPDAPHAPG